MNVISGVVGTGIPKGQTDPTSSAEPVQAEAFGVAMLLALLSSHAPTPKTAPLPPAMGNGLAQVPQSDNGGSAVPPASGATSKSVHLTGTVPIVGSGTTPTRASSIPGSSEQARVVPALAAAIRPQGNPGFANKGAPAAKAAPGSLSKKPGKPGPIAVSSKGGPAPTGVRSAMVSRGSPVLPNHGIAAASAGQRTQQVGSPLQFNTVTEVKVGAHPSVIGPTTVDPVPPAPARMQAFASVRAEVSVESLDPRSVPNTDMVQPARGEATTTSRTGVLRDQLAVVEPQKAVSESLKPAESPVARAPADVQPAQVAASSVWAQTAGAAHGAVHHPSSRVHAPEFADNGTLRMGEQLSDVTIPRLQRSRSGRMRVPYKSGQAPAHDAAIPQRKVRSEQGLVAEVDRGSTKPGSSENVASGRVLNADALPHAVQLRGAGVQERSAGANTSTISAKAEQLEQPVRTEQSTVRPQLTDRVTVKFTDAEGVEGRLRVAVRGQAVRATIVSDDATVARQLRADMGELQQALDQQGFRDAQVSVQHARRGADVMGIAVASAARAGTESSPSAQSSRGPEEQAHRERPQHDTRDHQNSGNGRSQQRSKQRQER